MDDSNKQIWQAVLGELELSLSKASFNTWLKDTFIAEICDGRVVVAVPNTFSQAWLKQKYHSKIYQILQKGIKDRIKDIVYKVQRVKNFQQQQDQLKKNITFESKRIGDSYGFKASPLPNTGLNPRYTFETFVVGRNSQLAHAASLAVAEKPGKMYNPFFIYGGVGLGKTHLMHAVGHSIFKADPSKKIIYVTCEKFTNDFINSISAGKMEQFNNIYRSPDVFLIDDIQFLANKEQTQEIFFHIFNELHQKDKQIIITSDRPPKAIATLEDRLLSRFEWGMIADISQPDLETRIAILQAKCTEKEFALEREIIQFITLNIQNNIR